MFIAFDIVLVLNPEDESAIEVWFDDLVRRGDDDLSRAVAQCRVGGGDILDVAVARASRSFGNREPRRKRFRRPRSLRRCIDGDIAVGAARRGRGRGWVY